MIRTRFAPSPTGDLHVGSAWTALASWTFARASGGTTILRVEDIDPPRVVAGAAARQLEDLAWLGLDWDESPTAGGPHAPYTQSSRTAIYDAALRGLADQNLTYLCDCSRAEIARVASAPHPGEEVVYPGTCRNADPRREYKRAPAIRLRVPHATTIAFDDLVRGHVEQRVDEAVGDFVLQRADGVFAYQLAVAVDDAAMEITHVIRADDLLASTPRQLLLMQLLGHTRLPTYAHVPLVIGAEGDRLAKRVQSTTIRALRERGFSASAIVATLASGLGLAAQRPSAWRTTPWPLPLGW